ncbi:MAG: helix-turn-helix domain-containing protein [Planctomycetaceae bacterium]
MAKKYLSLEEAAAALRIKRDDLIRLRERGAIRGFADRGTWKFKSEDVEEYRRQQQPDSSPDVPLMPSKRSDESSVLGDNDAVADQPTVIRGDSKGGILDGTSDSDVRLIVDDSVIGDAVDSDPEVQLPPLGDSDSDVRLVGDRGDKKRDKQKDSSVVLTEAGSDSDVQIIGSDSDSDVKLVGQRKSDGSSSSEVILSEADSDSDVRLVEEGSAVDATSDSDVQLVTEEGSKVGRDSDSDVALVSPGNEDTARMKLPKDRATDSSVLADDSGVTIAADGDSGLTLETASGIVLQEPDSGITMEAGDSGISLESVDSGLALETSDSGISLDAGDSGIALEGVSDSGISLDDSGSYALSDDSGIEVGSPSDSGIALDALEASDSSKLGATAPMVGTSATDDQGATQLDDEEDAVRLKRPAGDGETSVILFEDEDDAVAMKKSPGSSGDFDTLESETFDTGDSFAEAVDFGDEDLEVVEDVLGDSSADFDEIESLAEMDVFDAADEDFEESFVAGESEAEFSTATPVPAGRIAVAAEAEWGIPTFVGLVLTTVAMAFCGMVMFDLVRGMWAYNEPMAYNGVIIDFVSGLFK